MLENQIFKLSDGRSLGFAGYGNSKGKPLFYFHGWPASRLSARETDIAAEKLNVWIISIDRPGFGLSDYKKNRTLLDWPDDVIELADELKIDKFSIMGTSGGGPYSAVCAYKIPQRINKVGIIVGLAPTLIKSNLEGMNFGSRISWICYPKSSIFRNFAAFLANFQNKHLLILSKFNFVAKEDQRLMTEAIKRELRESINEAFKKGIKGPAWDLNLYTNDWGFNLNDIKTKVFLWYGANDKNVPLAMGKYYASQISDSKLTILEGGHLSRKQHMEEIIKALVD